MAVTRESKEQELQELEGAFKGTESAILVDYKGLKVPEVTELRRQIRGARGKYKVVKNTLATRAIKGTPFEPLTQFRSEERRVGKECRARGSACQYKHR